MEMNEVTLETERLVLRWFCEDDFESLAQMYSDPEVMRFLGGKMMTSLEAWRHMASMMGHCYLRRHGISAVEEKSGGNLLGRIRFINPTVWPGSEVGCTVAPRPCVNGYA